MQHQKTTVGLVDAARADKGEIRDQRAHFRFALHAAEQIHGGGVVFHYDGSAIKLAVVHQQVNFVAVEHSLHRSAVRVAQGAAVPLQKGIGIFKDVFAQGRKVGIQPLDRAGLEHALLNGVEEGGQHLGHGFAFQAALVVLKAFFRLVQLPHVARHGLHEVVATAFEAESQGCVQPVELFLAQALAFHQRIQGQTAAFVHIKVESLVYGNGIHLAQQAHARVLEVVHNLGAALYVGAGLKTARQLIADMLDQFLKVLL